jgi:hypothetical protein
MQCAHCNILMNSKLVLSNLSDVHLQILVLDLPMSTSCSTLKFAMFFQSQLFNLVKYLPFISIVQALVISFVMFINFRSWIIGVWICIKNMHDLHLVNTLDLLPFCLLSVVNCYCFSCLIGLLWALRFWDFVHHGFNHSFEKL